MSLLLKCQAFQTQMPGVFMTNTRHFGSKLTVFRKQTRGIPEANPRHSGNGPCRIVKLRFLRFKPISIYTDWYYYIYIYIIYISLAVILPVKLPAILPQNHTSFPFSVAELLSVIFTFTKSPTRCVPLSKTTTRFCSVRPKSWSRERLDTPSTNTS